MDGFSVFDVDFGMDSWMDGWMLDGWKNSM
jgi:hypothetical protein